MFEVQPCVFVKQSPGPFLCALPSRGRGPFSRSYRTILPSSLATDHSSTFGFSPRPPVSVSGTGGCSLALEVFLGSMSPDHCPPGRSLAVLSGSPQRGDLPPRRSATPFNALFRQRAGLRLLRPSFETAAGIGILTNCPSATPFGYALGPD